MEYKPKQQKPTPTILKTTVTKIKKIKVQYYPQFQGEGDGASVKRFIGTKHVRNLDPFLMFDEAKFKLPAGFPDHPHRG